MSSARLRTARLTIAYNGSLFHGFAPNPEVPTVAGALTEALEKITQTEVELVAAGRTDAGVHARGQVVSVQLPGSVKLEALPKKLNSLCGPHIAVRDARWAEATFHARYTAIWRHYRYTILNTPTPDPFVAATAWHVRTPLDIRPMQLACDAVMGSRDFSAFCRKPDSSEKKQTKQQSEAVSMKPASMKPVSMKRFVMQATWRREGDLALFEIRANAFCHQMVRSLVGTFVDIGLGKRPPSDMMSLIRSGRRQDASPIAPPHGLCLWEVGYPTPVE
ncbi:MAG: tRNA pseudouridine(38-40) synthase TruA [Ilumatobacteraceae bacterium]